MNAAGSDACSDSSRGPEGLDADPGAAEADGNSRGCFVMTTTYLVTVGIVLCGTAAPPDPVSQLFFFVPTLILVPVIGYWLVYRDGYERVGASLPSTRRVLATVFADLVAIHGLQFLVRAANLPIDAWIFSGAVGSVLAVWVAFFEGDRWLLGVVTTDSEARP